MTTLLPVAVAIATEWIATAVAPVVFQRRERRLLIWTQLEHGHYGWPAPCPNAPAKLSSHQRCACQGAGPAGAGLGVFAADAALVAATGLAGCSGSSDFASNGKMREILFLSG